MFQKPNTIMRMDSIGMCSEDLAGQCESASAEVQRDLLTTIYDTLWENNGRQASWTGEVSHRFEAMLDCEAFESAAMLLLPAGWGIASLTWEPGTGDNAVVTLRNGDARHAAETWAIARSEAPTMALALCAAGLRARSALATGIH